MIEHGVVALIVLAIFVSVYQRGTPEVVVVGVICGVLLLLLAAPAVTVASILPLSILAIAFRKARRHRASYALAGAAGIILVYALGIAVHYPKFREAAEMREKYPPIFLAERLAFEPRKLDSTSAPAGGDLSEPVAMELKRFEGGLRDVEFGATGSRRHAALRSLAYMHGGFVDDFMRAQGFGFVRMGPRLPAERRYIEIPDLLALPQPETSAEPSEQTPGALPAVVVRPGDEEWQRREAPDHGDLRYMHETSAVDFANPLGFGYAVGRERVVGFQPHAFRNPPALPAGDNRSARWQIASLELVSLLKHAEPVVYLSRHLPRMDELVDASTRPLDAFESRALAKIRAGEQIVLEEDTEELRMLGSLRAAQQCTQCHTVNRGDLLGAFTYRMRRDVPVRPKRPLPSKPVT